jgi:protoheme IX farnesyltransferase
MEYLGGMPQPWAENREAMASSVAVGRARDYLDLMKPRVMALVIFTGWVGMVIAPGSLGFGLSVCVLMAIALGAGAAGAYNMWYDRDIDACMERTRLRPIVAGRISPDSALTWVVLMGWLSLTIMQLSAGWVPTFWLAVAMIHYGWVYTRWLKRSTDQNIVIGGFAGALPPVIGWSSVASLWDITPWALCGIIFFWTCPHFWALALVKRFDYEKLGIPMLPISRGSETTLRWMLYYAVATWITSLLPYYVGHAGWLYGGAAWVLGGIGVYACDHLRRHYSSRLAMQVFFGSIFYLFILFLLLAVDHWWVMA